MSGIPKFGKNWLDNFIPDPEMQNTFMTSEVVRNVVMLQCVYYASIYNDLWLYKHQYINNYDEDAEEKAAQRLAQGGQISMKDLQKNEDIPPFKIGIIGCGQVGTVILTKLLEVREQIGNMQLMVSTRQPHLLKQFQTEFGVDVLFDNQKVAATCDLIFMTVLPAQTEEVLRDIRDVMQERISAAKKDRNSNKPIIVSTAAAIGYKKLKLMLSDQAVFLKTNVHVPIIKEYLVRSQAIVAKRASSGGKDGMSTNSKGTGAKELMNEAEQEMLSEQKGASRGSGMPESQGGGRRQNQSKPSSKQYDRVLSSRAISVG